MALALAFIGTGTATVSAEDIYKWTDGQGRVHYSNKGTESPTDSGSNGSALGGEGWESVLERQQGAENRQQQADAAINALELQRTRKRRDMSQLLDDLQATQAEISRAKDPDSMPALKAREETQTAEARRLAGELGAIEQDLVKLRTIKAGGKDGTSH